MFNIIIYVAFHLLICHVLGNEYHSHHSLGRHHHIPHGEKKLYREVIQLQQEHVHEDLSSHELRKQMGKTSSKNTNNVRRLDPNSDEPFNPTSPPIPAEGNRGMMIDAGSGGSRIHIYSWNPRVFDTAPPPITFVNTDEKWTDVVSPGLQSFADNSDGLSEYLTALIDFARVNLAEYHRHWHYYPIYLRATGGMRQVPIYKREVLMNKIRDLMSNKTFCPFYFQFDFARVLSGEEEGAFAWAATNYLMDALLPTLTGTGDVILPTIDTFGTVDLGGASTQISYFVPSQDISDGLFKLQIGSQRHWNIYSKSFLQFGYNSAQARHFQSLVDRAYYNGLSEATDYCLFVGYRGQNVTISNSQNSMPVVGPQKTSSFQFDMCFQTLIPLLNKDLNSFCNFAFHDECSMNGAYQPKLPTGLNGHFLGTSTFKNPWAFLGLPTTASLNEFRKKAKNLCKMTYDEVVQYNKGLAPSKQNAKLLPNYCYLSAYIIALLEIGYGFTPDMNLTCVDVINGHKLGWPLGSMLYEINSLPFTLVNNCTISTPPSKTKSFMENPGFTHQDTFSNYLIVFILGLVLGILLAALCIWRRFAEQMISNPSPSHSPLDHAENWSQSIIQLNPFRRSQYERLPDDHTPTTTASS